MKCEVCRRETEVDSSLCAFHKRAGEALRSGYRLWREAYGELSWEEYLDGIIENGETGEWAVDVARMMLLGKSKV